MIPQQVRRRKVSFERSVVPGAVLVIKLSQLELEYLLPRILELVIPGTRLEFSPGNFVR
ncbi:hypothetical protein Ocin01_09617, partial [Orchesella cincta]